MYMTFCRALLCIWRYHNDDAYDGPPGVSTFLSLLDVFNVQHERCRYGTRGCETISIKIDEGIRHCFVIHPVVYTQQSIPTPKNRIQRSPSSHIHRGSMLQTGYIAFKHRTQSILPSSFLFPKTPLQCSVRCFESSDPSNALIGLLSMFVL